jgi:hypothetical protein
MSNETAKLTSEPGAAGSAGRESDAIYQKGRVVARVVAPEVDLEAKEIRFQEINQSDELLLPEECEFQKYRILIQDISWAVRLDRGSEHLGRILRGVRADILGYREQ